MQALLQLKESVQQYLPLLIALGLWCFWPKIQTLCEQVWSKFRQISGGSNPETIDYTMLEKKYGIVGEDNRDPERDAFHARRIYEAAIKEAGGGGHGEK